jgi:hypothetical protein
LLMVMLGVTFKPTVQPWRLRWAPARTLCARAAGQVMVLGTNSTLQDHGHDRPMPNKAKATLLALLRGVTIYSDRIEIALCRGRAADLLAGQSVDLAARHQRSDPASHDVMTLRIPARLKRVDREMRMLVEGADDQTAADSSLLRVIGRAHDIQGRLSQNTDLTMHDIAREERVTAAFKPPAAAPCGWCRAKQWTSRANGLPRSSRATPPGLGTTSARRPRRACGLCS